MMIDFESKIAAAELVDDPLGEMATRADTRLLSGPEAFLFFHTVKDTQKRLAEALDENKRNEATIKRLREQILRHLEQERSMEDKIIQLSTDLARAKAEVDLQQLKLSQLEFKQQPQENTLHGTDKHASKETNQVAFTYLPSRRKKGTHSSRSHSWTSPSTVAFQMDDDVDKDTTSSNMGWIGKLDSSFRSLRRSLTQGQDLTGSMKSESSSCEKMKPRSVSMNDTFDCDNNSAIEWPDS